MITPSRLVKAVSVITVVSILCSSILKLDQLLKIFSDSVAPGKEVHCLTLLKTSQPLGGAAKLLPPTLSNDSASTAHMRPKVFVAARMSPGDGHLLNHFFPYYLGLGVDGFFINFNAKDLSEEDDLRKLMNTTLAIYGPLIRYNYGPNGRNSTETDNYNHLWELTDAHVDKAHDFLIPADTDEFHDYAMPLRAALETLEAEGADYIAGSTLNHISADGCAKAVVDGVNIFQQFPKTLEYNEKPKVGLFRARFTHVIEAGHHGFSKNVGNISKTVTSLTHHFRYNLQGKAKKEDWIELMKDKAYQGWKGVTEYQKELALLDACMDMRRVLEKIKEEAVKATKGEEIKTSGVPHPPQKILAEGEDKEKKGRNRSRLKRRVEKKE